MFFKLKEKIREWRTGQVRTHAQGVRGRVYAQKDDGTNPGGISANARRSASVTAKVIRADGTVEELGVLANKDIK